MMRTAALFATGGFLVGLAAGAADAPASVRSIIDLQPYQISSSTRIRSGPGKSGTARLTNLNPSVNAWFLLSVAWDGGGEASVWHLENPKPHEMQVVLEEKYPSGLVIVEGSNRYSCDLFGGRAPLNALEQGRDSQRIYYPLCGGRLYLRNPAKGQRTKLEAATGFLRDQVWGGEKVIVLFHHLLADRYRDTGELRTTNQASLSNTPGGPLPALLAPEFADRVVIPENLGITITLPGTVERGMAPGKWYPAEGNPAVFLSIIRPNLIAGQILKSYGKLVSNLDNVEAISLAYLIAFDLDQLELGFALGTQNPEVDWSEHMTSQMKNSSLPGPDGIGSISPLVSTGLIQPDNGRRTIATFTGGFKRNHGAFNSGALSLQNHGSHYGFIENGVVFSKLQPGLATAITMNDGNVDMKTWQESDNKLLPAIRHARQNGVPLIDSGVPGSLVNRWGPGNWSGSENEKLRSIRASAAIQKSGGKHFLIYAVFSDATPSAMARVFQAYQCNYAMLLDMNALEHTYLALYRRSGSELSVEHLIKGMNVLDQSSSSGIIPRFLGYPDNRDFFYVMRRNLKEVKP